MSEEAISVREMTIEDIEHLIQYWLSADRSFLIDMGVNPSKVPEKEEWEKILGEQLSKPYEAKKAYYIIWLLGNLPVGHSNVNKIIFGKEAYMHLHIWDQPGRRKGMGINFVKKTLPFFFNNLKLQKIYCEPYALNPAPNKTLQKAGFRFIKQYITTPGWLNFEQPVNLWELNNGSSPGL